MPIASAWQRLLNEGASMGHSTYIGHTETALWSIRPKTMSSCIFHIHVKLSVDYCSITDWLNRSDRYSVALYTEQDESSWQANAEFFKVSSNIIPLIYNYTLPSDFQTNFCCCNFRFSEHSHMHHKSHSPKAHYKFPHGPVNFSNLTPNILMYVCPCIIYKNDERYQLDTQIFLLS